MNTTVLVSSPRLLNTPDTENEQISLWLRTSQPAAAAAALKLPSTLSTIPPVTVMPSAVVVNTSDGAVVIAAPGLTCDVFCTLKVYVTGCPGTANPGPLLVTTIPGLNNSTTFTSDASVWENCWPLGGT